MSAVCILAPVVIAGWPAFSAAVTAAAASLGYQIVSEVSNNRENSSRQTRSSKVQIEISRSELITNQLGRDQTMRVTRDGVTITFSRDARGKASLCVTGSGQSENVLRALGEELSQRVVQQYVYQKLMDEMHARGFVVVEQETAANQAIRLKVRHWER